jgi:hypothetical protein
VHDAGDVAEQVGGELGRGLEAQAPGLELSEREQVGDEPAEPVGLDLHRVDEVVADLGHVFGPVLEQLEHALERGDRRAHLVARIGDEAALRVFDPVLLGDVGQQKHRAVDVTVASSSGVECSSTTAAERRGPVSMLARESGAHDVEYLGLVGDLVGGQPTSSRPGTPSSSTASGLTTRTAPSESKATTPSAIDSTTAAIWRRLS